MLFLRRLGYDIAAKLWGLTKARAALEDGSGLFPPPQNVHEEGIKTVFQGRVEYDRDMPATDTPLVLMAFTNRSGSNLLGDYLRQTGQVEGFGEYLNTRTVEKQAQAVGVESLPAYLRHMAGRFGADRCHFGLKASAEQLNFLAKWHLLEMFPSVTVLHIHRDDLVGQAVSHWIASRTGQWTSLHDAKDCDIQFEAEPIADILRDIAEADQTIRMIAVSHGLNYVSVSYEELTHDPRSAIRRVGDAVGLDLSEWSPAKPGLSRQADERNIALVKQFRSHMSEKIQE